MYTQLRSPVRGNTDEKTIKAKYILLQTVYGDYKTRSRPATLHGALVATIMTLPILWTSCKESCRDDSVQWINYGMCVCVCEREREI